jgi:K(+)-stimulated pyrophosphate-energized sodium pump
MENHFLFLMAPLGAVAALLFAFIFFRNMKKEDPGNERMQTIAGYVKEGAQAYLRQQYRVVALFFLAAFLFFLLLAFVLKVQSPWVPFAFVSGGFFSALAGYIGMKTATMASVRTAQAARTSLNKALQVAFRSGSVMGLTVVGLALIYITGWFSLLYYVIRLPLAQVTSIMLSFGIGASAQALFARVGGGIYTKAADVGADLVGKFEAGIPEDDPRNPAAIADNVGDNVGDVAGMGADLYESYSGSILAAAALGVASGFAFRGAILPMLIAGGGILLSIIGIFLIRVKEGADQNQLLRAINRGIYASALLMVIFSFLLVKALVPQNFGFFWAIVIGLGVGIVIGKATEYFTSCAYNPTKRIAGHAETGAATEIISGIGVGMISTVIPVLAIGFCILLSYLLSGGLGFPAQGLYGVALASVGMLSTLGITMATDAYGPIADNAGGNAEMSRLPCEVRERTDALDSLGNTTAATGKGYAIGSAALTALALIAAYVEEIRAVWIRLIESGRFAETIMIYDKVIAVKDATMADLMIFYQVTLSNPMVIIGLFIGAMLCFAFSGLTMNAVGRSAGKMVDEVRRQFLEITGIMEGKAEPDYASCVLISTKAAQKEMMLPSLLAIIVPVGVGLVLGVAGVMGLLVGALTTGFVLAVFMANSGGAWDNAKKFIETGAGGGKGSAAHKASIIGDTVGDPFKDTSGPSLNILIKLMSMVSLVVAGLVVVYHIF